MLQKCSPHCMHILFHLPFSFLSLTHSLLFTFFLHLHQIHHTTRFLPPTFHLTCLCLIFFPKEENIYVFLHKYLYFFLVKISEVFLPNVACIVRESKTGYSFPETRLLPIMVTFYDHYQSLMVHSKFE